MARPSLLVGAASVPNWIFPARSLPGYSGKIGRGEKSSLGDCFNGESVASQSQEGLGVLAGFVMGAPGLGWDFGTSVHSQLEPLHGFWCQCWILCWIRDWYWGTGCLWRVTLGIHGIPGCSGIQGAQPALLPGLPRELCPSPSPASLWILSCALGGSSWTHPSPPPGRGTGPWNVPSQDRDHAWGRPLRSPILARWDPGRCQHPSRLLVAIPSSRGWDSPAVTGLTGSIVLPAHPTPVLWAGASRDGIWISWSSAGAPAACSIHPNLPEGFPAPAAPATVHDWRA